MCGINTDGRKNILFNDTLNTFYLWLYGVRHMVKDHSDSERGNPLLPHGLLFLIDSKGSFICTIPDRIAHTTAFVTPVVEHWLEREIAQWVHHEGSIRRPIAPWVNALTKELHLTPDWQTTILHSLVVITNTHIELSLNIQTESTLIGFIHSFIYSLIRSYIHLFFQFCF